MLKKINEILYFVFNKKNYLKKVIDKNSKEDKNRIDLLFKNDFLTPTNQYKDEDVFIIGFPKSGNTWMQTIASCLLFGIDSNFMSDKLAQEIVPDIQSRSFYKRFNTFNFFKTHDLPKKEFKKVIYIVRDGRDAITSYLHFKKNLGVEIKISDFYKNEDVVFPTFWHLHTRAWLDNPFNSEILYIRYEDLLEKPTEVLYEILEFTGLKRNEDLLKKIISGSSIDNMRNRVVETGGMGNSKWLGEKGAKFFRKGKIGDYKNHMSAQEISEFNEISKNELTHFGYLD